MGTATLLAGIPEKNFGLYHAIRFSVGDPAALVVGEDGRRTLIIRDIELARAKKHARADEVFCPADFAPAGGLSADREIATAQATAECLKRGGVTRVRSDRSLPFLFVDQLRASGFEVVCDRELGIAERRAKDAQEIEALRDVQGVTEQAMEMACGLVARSEAGAGGVLQHEGSALTADRVRGIIDVWLLERGYTTPGNIVACGKEGADCHNRGEGPLYTGQPIIIDIFPQSRKTKYNGDCTRVVVHGDVPDEVARMHAAVTESLQAGIDACRAGVTADAAYQASIDVIRRHGWDRGLPDGSPDFCSMQHGLGHGVGLEVHEPPLVDAGGPELIAGDCVTLEPGLYHATLGGIRVEDMVIVTADGCDNLNSLPWGLDWS